MVNESAAGKNDIAQARGTCSAVSTSDASPRRAVLIVSLTVAACMAMTLVETLLQPGYAIKSLLKVAVFLSVVVGYSVMHPSEAVWKTLRIRSAKSLAGSLLLGIGVMALIIGAFLAVRPFVDFSAIVPRLAAKESIGRNNFLGVALYISFCNSMLEELFFRGFAFLTLRRHVRPWLAHGFSAGAFALYHVFIMDGWFNPLVFAGLIAALAVSGLFFNWLDRKSALWNSWIVHMSANLAINGIGMMLLGML